MEKSPRGSTQSLNSSWEIWSYHMCKLNYSLHYCRLQPSLISLFQLYSFFLRVILNIFKPTGEFKNSTVNTQNPSHKLPIADFCHISGVCVCVCVCTEPTEINLLVSPLSTLTYISLEQGHPLT